jgi:hypothetical protein
MHSDDRSRRQVLWGFGITLMIHVVSVVGGVTQDCRGTTAFTVVPDLPSEKISRVPPNCRRRSSMLLIPTPYRNLPSASSGKPRP